MIEIGASRTRGFCLNFGRHCNKKKSSDRKVSEFTLQGIGKLPLGDICDSRTEDIEMTGMGDTEMTVSGMVKPARFGDGVQSDSLWCWFNLA